VSFVDGRSRPVFVPKVDSSPGSDFQGIYRRQAASLIISSSIDNNAMQMCSAHVEPTSWRFFYAALAVSYKSGEKARCGPSWVGCTPNMQKQSLTPEAKPTWKQLRTMLAERIMASDLEALFVTKQPAGPVPHKARILSRLTCDLLQRSRHGISHPAISRANPMHPVLRTI
jgi:hypothetical protein